jgi:hypothetical protein
LLNAARLRDSWILSTNKLRSLFIDSRLPSRIGWNVITEWRNKFKTGLINIYQGVTLTSLLLLGPDFPNVSFVTGRTPDFEQKLTFPNEIFFFYYNFQTFIFRNIIYTVGLSGFAKDCPHAPSSKIPLNPFRKCVGTWTREKFIRLNWNISMLLMVLRRSLAGSSFELDWLITWSDKAKAGITSVVCPFKVQFNPIKEMAQLRTFPDLENRPQT